MAEGPSITELQSSVDFAEAGIRELSSEIGILRERIVQLELPGEAPSLSKRDFLTAYIIGRAQGHAGGLFAHEALTQGLKAWDWIEKECGRS